MEEKLRKLLAGKQQIAQQDRVMAKAFAAKFKSKYEVYRFLTLDVRAYLPPYETITIYFMKSLIAGESKCKCPSLRHHPSAFCTDIKQY